MGRKTLTLPSRKSPGNAGSRGSEGLANDGAKEGTDTNPDGDGGREAAPEAPDLRDADAQGGAGPSSKSSRGR